MGIWHSSIHLIIINEDRNKTLFQQRCADKKLYPNMWDIAVGGHISAGEDDKVTVRKELKEELGLNPDDYNIEFVSIFIIYANIDIKNIKLQKEEVSNVKWITKEEMNNLISNNQVILHKEEYNLLNSILK